MLLDENLNSASEAESSLAEDSFANGQNQTVLLDQVREFQPDEQIAEADRQIYADQDFNYIPPQQRVTPRVSEKSKDDVLKRAREIAQQNKKAAQPKEEKQAVKNATQKKHTEEQTRALTQAKETAAKNKKAKQKKTEANAESENGEQGLAKKVLPDKAKLVYDATHGDPRQIVGDLADQYLHAGRRAGDALFFIWIIMTIVTSLTIVGGIFSFFMLNLLLVAPNWNYRITRWILDFILDFFGVGEVLTVLQQFGFTKIDVKLNGLEKGAIVAFDVVVIIIIFALAALSFTLTCATTGRLLGYVPSFLDIGGLATQISSACSQVNQSTGL